MSTSSKKPSAEMQQLLNVIKLRKQRDRAEIATNTLAVVKTMAEQESR